MRVAFAALLIAAGAAAAQSDGETRLDHTPGGDYLLTYDCGEDGGISQAVLEPATKIAPAIDSTFALKGGRVEYRYDILLGPASRQPLMMFVFDPVLDVISAVAPLTKEFMDQATRETAREYGAAMRSGAPSGWMLLHMAGHSSETRVGWARDRSARPFEADARADGFAFSSRHLPGVFAAEFKGDTKETWGFPCEMPGGKNVDALLRNDHVPRFAAAPVIKVDEPFDAGAVLGALHSHVAQLERWQLFDAPFAAQASTHLAQALDRLKAKDRAAAAKALSTLRTALRGRLGPGKAPVAVPPKEVPRMPVDDMQKMTTDYDRALAVRVLDFDVQYVAGRLD